MKTNMLYKLMIMFAITIAMITSVSAVNLNLTTAYYNNDTSLSGFDYMYGMSCTDASCSTIYAYSCMGFPSIQNQSIFFSLDSGVTWNIAYSNLTPTNCNGFKSFTDINDNGWVAAYSDRLMKYDKLLGTYTQQDISRPFNYIVAPQNSNGEIFIFTYTGNNYGSSDFGVNTQLLDPMFLPGTNLCDVTCNENNCQYQIAVECSSGYFYTTDSYGDCSGTFITPPASCSSGGFTAWTSKSVLTMEGYFNAAYSADISPSGQYQIVGASGAENGIFYSSDYGQTWNYKSLLNASGWEQYAIGVTDTGYSYTMSVNYADGTWFCASDNYFQNYTCQQYSSLETTYLSGVLREDGIGFANFGDFDGTNPAGYTMTTKKFDISRPAQPVIPTGNVVVEQGIQTTSATIVILIVVSVLIGLSLLVIPTEYLTPKVLLMVFIAIGLLLFVAILNLLSIV